MNPTRDFNLDSVSLDDFTVRRLSAMLHFGGGDHPDTRDSPYWVYLACEPIAERYDVSPRSVWIEASTVSGRSVRVEVRIVAAGGALRHRTAATQRPPDEGCPGRAGRVRPPTSLLSRQPTR
jgi:hypothetical protein